jgi:type II secretory pathway component PulF
MAAVATDQVLPLYQELAALMRAGVPLGPGLRAFAGDLRGSLATLASDLADRIERGEPIADALTGIAPNQRAYAAVLAAGLRSGEPAAALENVVETAVRYQQLRQALWAELIYPAFLLVLGLGLVGFSMSKLLPVSVRASTAFDAMNPEMEAALTVVPWYEAARPWLPWLITIAAIAVAWLIVRATSPHADPGKRLHLFARMRAAHAQARFLDLLALLVEHRVPLPDALVLAGEGSHWKSLSQAANEAAAQLRTGQPPRREPPLPAATGWLFHAENAGEHLPLLRREAQHARRHAERMGRAIVAWLPVMLTLLIGVGYVVLLAAINLGPFLNLLHRMSQPLNG